MLKLYILLIISVAYAIKTSPDEDYYLAAVVEYSAKSGNDSITLNANEYATIIQKAADKADIIVFPEFSLFLYDGFKTYIEVPFGNDSIAPFDDPNAHPVLKVISQAANDQGVYVVINVHEKYESNNKTYHYNTNVVFNRTGNIIARYRKFNLFGGEPTHLDVTPTPEHVFFDTDFGVRFGTFICFDILFEKPALELVKEYNITDFVYPTFWYTWLPFNSASQTQSAWAYANDVNLLAAGGNSVECSHSGSGVYAGKKGPVVYLLSQRDETAILFSKVYKKGTTGKSTGTITPVDESPIKGLLILEDPVVNNLESSEITPQTYNESTFEIIPHPEDTSKVLIATTQLIEQNLCKGKFCCSFKVNMTVTFKPENASEPSLNPYQYRIAVFDGTTTYGVQTVGAQLCSVVSCLNSTLGSCGKSLNNEDIPPLELSIDKFGNISLYSTVFHRLEIQTESLDDEVFVTPSILELSSDPNVYGSLMSVSKFSLDSNKNGTKLVLSSDNLITGGIYGRVFSRDGKSSANHYISSVVLVLISSTLFYIF